MDRVRNLLVDGATVASAVAAVVVTVYVVTGRAPSDPFAERDPRDVRNWESLIEEGQRRGPDDPILTILEFGDYQCPACRLFESTLRPFVDAYPSQVALVHRHWPLPQHADAYPAARAAECAGEAGRFWQYHQILYERRDREWTTGGFHQFAVDAGVEDIERFSGCLANPEPVPSIERSIEAARQIDAYGTPGLVIDGVLLGKIPNRDELEELLEQARSRAGGDQQGAS